MNKTVITLGMATLLAISIYLVTAKDPAESSDSEPALFAMQSAPDAGVEIDTRSEIKSETALATTASQQLPGQDNTSHSPSIKQVMMSPIERMRAIQNKTELQQSVLAEHMEFSRYAANNQRFETEQNDPLIKRYQVDERTTLNEDKTSALTVWSDKKFYQQGDTIVVYARLQDAAGNTINTEFAGQLIFNESKNLQQLMLQDTNGDGIYSTSIQTQTDSGDMLDTGVYKILIVNRLNKVADAVAVMLSNPGAVFTGAYRDRASVNGDLLIEVEVEVEQKTRSRYYLQGSLYSSTNDPIGSSQYAGELGPGRHWLPLTFDQKMILDAGEPGPYLLRNLALSKVDIPVHRSELLHPNYYTQSYSETTLAALSK